MGQCASDLDTASDGTDTVIACQNNSELPLELYLDQQGPVLSVGSGKAIKKPLPAKQLDNVSNWHARVVVHGNLMTVASGKVRGNSVEVRVPLLEALRSELSNDVKMALGMTVGVYKLLVQAQQAWRHRLQARAAARALRERLAAKVIQRQLLAHLRSSPRTCMICFDTVRWDEMTTLVPAQRCHRTCASCATRHVDLALTEGRMHVRCPGEGCRHQLSADSIQSLASASALQSWKDNKALANARRASGLAAEDAEFRRFCSQHARACPACHVLIYRHDGCNHMTCMCGHEFDWDKTQSAKIGTDGRVGGADAADAATAPVRTPARPARLRHPAAQLAPRSRGEEEAQLAAAIAESLSMVDLR